MTTRNTPNPGPPVPPALPTLDVKASWQNRAGRVDRSCCFVLSAAELWRQLPGDAWRHAPHADAEESATKRLVQRPPTQPKRPDRVGSIALTAQDLWHYHRFERPAPLRGDFRTTKSNAFKPAAEATRWWNEVSASQAAASHAGDPPGKPGTPGRGPAAIHTRKDDSPARLTTPSPLDPPAVNPNRGAGFSIGLKMLGLGIDWQTTLRIERYLQHAKLKQHFLVCPVCETAKAADAIGGLPNPQNLDPNATPPNPRGNTADAIGGFGRKNTPPARNKKRPPKLPAGRVTKLFLPLCTPQEWHDAQLTHLWLQTHTNPNRPYSAAVQKLLTRYAELFPGRNLRCRHCLGLRYGEVKGLR